MAFINEYVSEEDIQKYKLDNLINTVLELPEDCMRMPERRLKGDENIYWTVDKSINCWLMYMTTVFSYEGSRSGKPEPTREKLFCFFWKNQVYKINILLSDKSSLSFADVPFMRVWEKLLSITPETCAEEEKQVFMIELKQAFTVLGQNGIKRQVPNTIVEFEF